MSRLHATTASDAASDETKLDGMKRLVFAAVADDDTGASDLAGMLAEQGLHTLLVLDLPSLEEFAGWTRGYQAVVMAEATRNLAPAAAYERTRAAIRLVQTLNPRFFQLKYCSTFDSTPEGNIAFPSTRRSTNSERISPSPFRRFPLTVAPHIRAITSSTANCSAIRPCIIIR